MKHAPTFYMLHTEQRTKDNFQNKQHMARNQTWPVFCGYVQTSCNTKVNHKRYEGAQWLSGRVLDSRPRGRGFEPHRRHLSKTHLS